jgi:hypothetical protein
MIDLTRLNELREDGRMQWVGAERAWAVEPGIVVQALTGDGFQEYKHEVTRSRPNREPTGGVWQGLDGRTGNVASAIWVQRPDASALVFIDIDGQPVEGER